MPFVPAVNTMLMFTEYIGPASNLVGNTYWIRDDTGQPTVARMQAANTLFVNFHAATLRLQQGIPYALTTIRTRDMTVQSGAIADLDIAPPVPGTFSGDVLPANATFSVSLRTGFAGRSRRGRIYHVGLAEGQVTADFLITANVTAIVNAYTTWLTTLAAQQYSWVIASRISGGVPRATALITPITAIFAVDARVDTQRRRLPGEGT